MQKNWWAVVHLILVVAKKWKMNQKLKETILQISTENISEERKLILQPLIEYIKGKHIENKLINLNFICTHNSRRSHLSQIWAQTFAYYFDVKNVVCYSGGTEATAMFPKVGETIQEQGFEVLVLSVGDNSVYGIKYDENTHPIICFSKKYDDHFNPSAHFGAILTCDAADENCPVVMGAEARFSIKYEDPKKSDGTLEMDEVYFNRSLEIAAEMKYVFSQIQGK